METPQRVGWVESSRPTTPSGGSRRLDPPYETCIFVRPTKGEPMRYVTAVVALFVATACVGAEELQKATRMIEGTKTTFPAMTTPDGVKALTGALESCSTMDDRANQYTADDL